MNTLRDLLHLMTTEKHPRAAARDKALMIACGSFLAFAYAWAVFCIVYK